MTSTPTIPVDNVVITTKGLQDRNNLLLDGRTVENKGKLILIFVVNTTFSTGLVGVEVSRFSWLWQEITIISDLSTNCQLPKSGDRRNFNTQQDLLKMY